MCWGGALGTVNCTGFAEPSLQYGSVPFKGLLFFGSCTWCLSVMHPFVADWGYVQGRIIPKPIFGFLETFYGTVLSHYGCQVGETRDFTMADGVQDSPVRAIVAKDRDCVFLSAVLYPVHDQEESGPVMMYCFGWLLPD